MTVINIKELKEELVVFLRNQDIFTISQRGVATVTEEFDGTGSQTDFVLTNTPVRNIRSVTVGGSAQSLGSDYTVNYTTATVTFLSAPANGTDNVDIQYDHGSTDKIFPDYPKTELSISSFPRIGFGIITMGTDPAGFGNVTSTRTSITIIVYDKKTSVIEDYITAIRTAIRNNYTGFYYLAPFVTVRNVGPVINSPRAQGKDKIFQQNIDIDGHFKYEK